MRTTVKLLTALKFRAVERHEHLLCVGCASNSTLSLLFDPLRALFSISAIAAHRFQAL
jgi:hypothetical protein